MGHAGNGLTREAQRERRVDAGRSLAASQSANLGRFDIRTYLGGALFDLRLNAAVEKAIQKRNASKCASPVATEEDDDEQSGSTSKFAKSGQSGKKRGKYVKRRAAPQLKFHTDPTPAPVQAQAHEQARSSQAPSSQASSQAPSSQAPSSQPTNPRAQNAGYPKPAAGNSRSGAEDTPPADASSDLVDDVTQLPRKSDFANIFKGEEGAELRAELVELLAELVAQRSSKRQLSDTIDKALGMRVSYRLHDELIRDAKIYLCNLLDIPIPEAKGTAIGLMESIIRDPDTPALVKIEAQREISVMLGIDPRVKSADNTPAEDRAADIRAALKAMSGVTRGEMTNQEANPMPKDRKRSA